MGWLLLKHSYTLMINNLNAALRIGLVITLITTIGPTLILLSAVGVFGNSGGANIDAAIGATFGISLLMSVGFVIIAFVLGSLMAAAWHRFVLLNEQPRGWFPQLPEGILGGYMWRAVRLGFLIVLLLLPILIFASYLLPSIITAGGFLVSSLMTLLFGVPIFYIILRLSIVLPAKALGIEMSARDAWSATQPVAVDLLISVVILVAIEVVLTLVLDVIPFPIVIPFEFAANFFLSILGISLLTTLYGYCVEKREI